MSFKNYNSNNAAAKHITTLTSDLNGGYWGSINYKRQTKPSSSTLSLLSSTTTLSSNLTTNNGDRGNSFDKSKTVNSSSSSSLYVDLPSFMSPIVTPGIKQSTSYHDHHNHHQLNHHHHNHNHHYHY